MRRRVGVRRVVLLTLGWAELPKSYSLYGAPPDERLVEPICAVLVEVDGGHVLLDTGFNPALLRDGALRRRFHDRVSGIEAILPPGEDDPLLAALDAHGLAPDKIGLVALSHLHNDHAGGVRHFARSAPVCVQRAELDFGLSGAAERAGIFRIDFDDPAIDWRLGEGDTEIAPGIEAVLTAGHTPGHQSFVVRLDDSVGGGGFVFAFDAADLTENLEQERAVGSVVGGHPAGTIEHIRRLKAIAASEQLRLVPGHDPVVWPALTAELARTGPWRPPRSPG